VRLLHSSLGVWVIAVCLVGCSQGGPAPAETMLTMPASPSTEPSADAVPPSGSAVPLDAGESEARTDTQPAQDPSDHCVIVAGGVTTAMLAPLSLDSSSTPGELLALEQQILDLRDKVPAELHDDFTTLAHSVEAPPAGSGTFDEHRFRRAMLPVQDWLGRHCTTS
jgi:hypothetical protein